MLLDARHRSGMALLAAVCLQLCASCDSTAAVGAAERLTDSHSQKKKRQTTPAPELPPATPPPLESATQESQAPPGTCPPFMVPIGKACIDRYENHLLVHNADGALEPYPHYQRPPAGMQFIAASRPGVKPQGYISRVEAQAACEAAGKRLCSATEWYGACRGDPPSTYGYGARFEPGRCNVGKPHLLSRLYGTNPGLWSYEEHFNDPRLLQEPQFLAATGQYAECVTSSGAHDLIGNLHEWVADIAGPALAAKIPMLSAIRRTLHRHRGKGVFMGGFFSTTSEHGRGCNFVTVAHEVKYHDYSTGFRCCRDQ